MEITNLVAQQIPQLAREFVSARDAAQREDLQRRQREAEASDDADVRELFDSYRDEVETALDDQRRVEQAVADREHGLRDQVLRFPAPAPPAPPALVTRWDLKGRHPGCEVHSVMQHIPGLSFLAHKDAEQRAQGYVDQYNQNARAWHELRVADVQRYAYSTALEISPNLLCFTDFQRLTSKHAVRTKRQQRWNMSDEQDLALQEARVLAQAATSHLRSVEDYSKSHPEFFQPKPLTLRPNWGPWLEYMRAVGGPMSDVVERTSVAVSRVGDQEPVGGMIHALYGALFTSADHCLNGKGRNWEGAKIHLTHACNIFGAHRAHNNGAPFDAELEKIVDGMRADIEAGRDIGPIEPIIYALTDALTNY